MKNQEIRETKLNPVATEVQETSEVQETQYIFRPYMTLKDGRVIWARQYGKKAFKIPVA